MADMQSIQDSFFEECDDLLEALFEGLNQIEAGDQDPETINAVFRAVHSIKGGAGAFKLTELVSFAHTFETVLDLLRSNKLDSTPELLQLFLRSADQLANLVETSQSGAEIDTAARDAVLSELEKQLGDGPAEEEEIAFAPMALDFGGIDLPEVPNERTFMGHFKPHARLYQNGHEPAHLFAALMNVGDFTNEIDPAYVPPFGEYQDEDAHLSWKFTLTAEDPEAAISEVFEFVEGLCDLDIQEVETDDDPTDPPEPPIDDDGELAKEDAERKLPPSVSEDIPADSEPDEPAANAAADTPPDPPPPAPAKGGAPPKSGGTKPTLRVDLDRVDRLINTVGELIINQAVLTQRLSNVSGANASDIEGDLDEYKILARDLQEGVMAIRAQPVKALFQRMSRIVREASTATGKSARLNIRGETTEVDKTVIERLADPLTHMIRNAIDHGLEDVAGRAAANKDPVGEIRLSASHRSGNVLIEVADDGAGLNREKIKEIAVSKGLIPANTELTDSEVDQLLFMPGFSTAKTVSNLSGRGVGMDVVKNAIQALGGRVSISSELGKGTTFSIVLPLTLAVMDGMVVSVAGETMVMPITPILETIRPGKNDLRDFGASDQLLSIRGRHVPIVDVAQKLNLSADKRSSENRILVLVETEDAGQSALAVDEIYDQRQVVIKSVAGNYGSIPGVSAATILGNGSIALILDVDFLIRSKPVQREASPESLAEMES